MMMDLISVRQLFKNTDAYIGKEVEVGGWVRNRRPSKQFGFIVLNDGTYFTPVQVVYNDTIENFQELSKINIGAALIVPQPYYRKVYPKEGCPRNNTHSFCR